MDLFDYMREDKMEKESPLASRLRPRTLDEIVGQQHIIGRDKMLYRAIKADKLSSIILYGPPGNRQDNHCEGHCQYNQCFIYPDQCNGSRQEGHGAGGSGSEGSHGHVRQADNSVCGRDSSV